MSFQSNLNTIWDGLFYDWEDEDEVTRQIVTLI